LCILHSAFCVVFLACNPATTRPFFLPYPQAPYAVIDARPERLVPELTGWLTGQGLRIEFASTIDGFVESQWYNPVTKQSSAGSGDPGDLSNAIKIRCWADPNVPGKSQLTIEVVYRPLLDPSRPERDLERMVPAGSDGARLGDQLLGAMKLRFGQ